MSDPTPGGVLICGAYGTGKSTVVEPTAPWTTIERRLRLSPASGRLDDLERARTQVGSRSPSLADATIDGDRPVAEVAADILRLLRW